MPRPRKYKRPTNQTVTFEETELREIRRAAAATREPVSVFIRRLFLQALGGEAEESSNGKPSPSR
ncbi:MAG: hypothetical protein U0822_13955 [Anaerolineae bacterium]